MFDQEQIKHQTINNLVNTTVNLTFLTKPINTNIYVELLNQQKQIIRSQVKPKEDNTNGLSFEFGELKINDVYTLGKIVAYDRELKAYVDITTNQQRNSKLNINEPINLIVDIAKLASNDPNASEKSNKINFKNEQPTNLIYEMNKQKPYHNQKPNKQ